MYCPTCFPLLYLQSETPLKSDFSVKGTIFLMKVPNIYCMLPYQNFHMDETP